MSNPNPGPFVSVRGRLLRSLEIRVEAAQGSGFTVATDASYCEEHHVAITACVWSDQRALVQWRDFGTRLPGRFAELQAAAMALAPVPDGQFVHLVTDYELIPSMAERVRQGLKSGGRNLLLVRQLQRLNVMVTYDGGSGHRIANHPLLAIAHRLAYVGLQGFNYGHYEHEYFPRVLRSMAHRRNTSGQLKELYPKVVGQVGIEPANVARARLTSGIRMEPDASGDSATSGR